MLNVHKLVIYKKYRGGSMSATILPYAIILTKAHRATVSMMAKRCIVARVLPLTCFLFLLPNYIHAFSNIIQ